MSRDGAIVLSRAASGESRSANKAQGGIHDLLLIGKSLMILRYARFFTRISAQINVNRDELLS